MKKIYLFDERVVLRTPAHPYNDGCNAHRVDEFVKDDAFMEAIYLASPSLYQACMKYNSGKITNEKDRSKLFHSLEKYLLRMGSRSTPFGMFSGCSVLSWHNAPTDICLQGKPPCRYVRMDIAFLCKLSRFLIGIKDIREAVLFTVNDSLYQTGNEHRFFEYIQTGDTENYRLSSVLASDYLSGVLKIARDGVRIGEMAAWLLTQGYSQNDADAFVQEMIDCRLLVSELEPNVCGEECFASIIDVLKARLDGRPQAPWDLVHLLDEIRQRLVAINAGDKCVVADYQSILKRFEEAGIPVEDPQIFLVDSQPGLSSGRLSGVLQQKLYSALDALNRLNPYREGEDMRSFRERFTDRYGEREMPLAEVLDIESGIGYKESHSLVSLPLLHELPLDTAVDDIHIRFSAVDHFLQTKLAAATEELRFEMELEEEELAAFQADEKSLPASMSVMFRLFEGKEGRLYIEHAGGSGAANLLGRFAHGHEGIRRLTTAITQAEQATNSGVLFAEIVHLPETRTGNILSRPSLRDYEIGYLAGPGQREKHRININDLYVSVRDGEVILHSKSLNKRIIPRLSTAHNYSSNLLPVYLFLCDLQFQNQRGMLGFNWGILETRSRFLPRVVYKDTILKLARWRFQTGDLISLTTGTQPEKISALREFIRKWKLPSRVALAEGDNELPINFDIPVSVDIFLSSIRNKEFIVLNEFLAPDASVVNPEGKIYSNQFIATLIRKEPVFSGQLPETLRMNNLLKDSFEPGSEWLYYKVYCGIHAADKLLRDLIQPFTEKLVAKKLVKNWFFIRYHDPGFHLRIRLHINDVSAIGQIMCDFRSAVDSSPIGSRIWKIQVDTYQREIFRYGSNAMLLTEELFGIHTTDVLNMLCTTQESQTEETKWGWTMWRIDQLLNDFNLCLQGKIRLMDHLRNIFAREFRLEATARTKLNQRYRESRKVIDVWLNSCGEHPGERAIAEKLHVLENAGALDQPIQKLLASYVHMLVNRTITAQPRKQEMIIYDFMHRHYLSLEAKNISHTQVMHQ